MKVLFNGLSVVYPLSGVGQYTFNLGNTLESLLGHGSILWYGNNGSDHGAKNTHSDNRWFANLVRYQAKKGFRLLPGFTRFIHSWRNHNFKSFVRINEPTLYHETNYALFDYDDGPTVITLYDLSFIRHPEWHPKDRVKYIEKYCLKKLSQADAIITISEFSKREIVELLGINPQRIYVTYPGVDRMFKPEGGRMKDLPNEYILFVGNLEPRKNLPLLFDAYRSLPQKLRERIPLVIAGASGWHTKELKRALQPFPRNQKPILTGYVPQKNLPDLYRGATLFVYLSLYEGFGLPVLEAMASGIPVITSESTSLPEVVGDAGVLVNPTAMDDLKEAMIELLIDEKARQELKGKGIARAKDFSWDRCAPQTLSVYKNILGARE